MKSKKDFTDPVKIMNDVEGYLTKREGRLLYNLAKKCRGKGLIVEIGSWKGKSTICLGLGSKAGNGVRIFSIDPHTGSSEHKIRFGKVWTFKEFIKNIRKAKVDELISPLVMTSKTAAKKWKGKKIELLWIDGSHEYEFVELDYLLWEPHLIDGGIIAFHDTLEGGPRDVVNKYVFRGNKFTKIGFIDGIVYAEKKRKIDFIGKIRNKYILFLREAYITFGSSLLPNSLRAFFKKIFDYLE